MHIPAPIKDRRSAPRYEVNIKTNIIDSFGTASKNIPGIIYNLSSKGFLFHSLHQVPIDSIVAIELHSSKTNETYQYLGRLTWSRAVEDQKNAFLSGAVFTDPLIKDQNIEKFLTSIEFTQSNHNRRKKNDTKDFPIKRRQEDYFEQSCNSPYSSFFSSLKKISENEKIRTIVISKNIYYLKKRIRSLFPDPRIILTDKIDEQLQAGTLAILNLDCRRKHETFTPLDFEELQLKTVGLPEPLFSLNAISKTSTENTRVIFVSLGKIQNQKIATKYLLATKFQSVKFLNDHTITAEKRPLFLSNINNGRHVLREVQSDSQIQRIQNFAASIFTKDFDFSPEIDSLFNLHSDFYEIVDNRSGKIINFARITWHLPGSHLPCMLAVKKGTDLHLQLHDPDNYSYGEVFSPFINSLSSVKTYGALVKLFYSYGERGLIDFLFTTHSASEKKSYAFFSKNFGFNETGYILRYGSFGGDWNLIYSTKNHFNESININFISKDEPPTFYNPFLNK